MVRHLRPGNVIARIKFLSYADPDFRRRQHNNGYLSGEDHILVHTVTVSEHILYADGVVDISDVVAIINKYLSNH